MNSIEFNSLDNNIYCYVNYKGLTARVINIDKAEGLIEINLKANENIEQSKSVWVRYENCEIKLIDTNFSNTKEFHDL